MRYTTFGRRSGLRVSEIALGTGNFGTDWGGGADRAASQRMFELYAEAGGNFLDTADMYQYGTSETFLGELMGRERDHFVVSTKYGYGAGRSPSVSTTGNHRKNLMMSVEASLTRLQTDHVDVLWAHAPDGLTPTEEIAKGLEDLVRAGKVHVAGFSNFPAWRTAQAVGLAERFGWSPVSGIQIAYNLIERSGEREQLAMAEELGLGVAVWSPLAGGLLTGKYRDSDEGRLTDWGSVVERENSAYRSGVLDALIDESARLGAQPATLALAWLIERGHRLGLPLVPIVGPRTPEQLKGYLAALDLTVPAAVMARLDRVSAIDLGAPHEGNARQRTALRGGPGVAWHEGAPGGHGFGPHVV